MSKPWDYMSSFLGGIKGRKVPSIQGYDGIGCFQVQNLQAWAFGHVIEVVGGEMNLPIRRQRVTGYQNVG